MGSYRRFSNEKFGIWFVSRCALSTNARRSSAKMFYAEVIFLYLKSLNLYFWFFCLVMADHPKALAQVFEAAQEQLRQVFGMELAPVGTRSRQTAGRSGNTANSNQNRADHQAQQFILRSVIPGELAAACVPQPRTAEHGLLMLILTLIFVNADQLADGKYRLFYFLFF